MPAEVYAIMHRGAIYTLHPFRNPHMKKQPFRWKAYRDGDAWGLFKTKAEFDLAVSMDRPAPWTQGPHAIETDHAILLSTMAIEKTWEQIEARLRRPS